MPNRYYYLIIAAPGGNTAMFFEGPDHPLTKRVWTDIQTQIARKLSLATGQVLPAEAVVLTNCMEVDEAVFLSHFPRPPETPLVHDGIA